MELDHAADVLRVLVAEVVVDLVMDRVELLGELLELLVAEPMERILDRSSVLMLVRHQSLQINLHVSLRRVNADPDHLALLTVHLAGPQVPDLPLGRAADAGVADPHPAAVGEVGPGLLTSNQDRNARPAGRRRRR